MSESSESSETRRLEETITGPNTRIESSSAVKTQVELDKEAQEDAKKNEDKINEEIKNLNDDAKKKLAELDLKKNVDGITHEKIQSISVEQNAIIDNLFEKLQQYSNTLSGGNIPLPISFGLGTWDFIKDYFLDKIKKVELGTEVTKIELEILDIIGKEVENIKKNGGPANPMYLQQLVELLISLKKQIQSKPAGEATGGGATPAAGLDSGAAAAAAAAAAAGKLPPGAAEAAKALGGAAGAAGKEGGEAGAAVAGGEAAAAAVAGGEEEVSLLPDPTEEEDDEGQGGGGISRKRSHSKYMNQVSENRNKIFKKELEIINSIRRFHRSHTIRKRDKINNILGLRKSRSSKRGVNTKHTRRHRHNKHKSAKHIKK
jgi:hypothetical protein